MADNNGPAVVHCSAGVGRTGTLLALDIGIQSLLQGDTKIDILRIVSTLRQDRPGMVQTREQYKFIHQVYNCYFIILIDYGGVTIIRLNVIFDAGTL